MCDLSEWITDGTPEDLDARARRMSLVTALTYEQARDAVAGFTLVVHQVMKASVETVDELARLTEIAQRAVNESLPATAPLRTCRGRSHVEPREDA